MTIVDGPWIAAEHLLIVALILESVLLVALIAVAVTAIYYDKGAAK
jgi:hypothetical protein